MIITTWCNHSVSLCAATVEIFPHPRTGVYTTGDIVYIECEYSSDLMFDSFVHPMFGQFQRSMDPYFITNRNNVATFELRDITEEDSGTYFCTFNSQSGGRDHQYTELTFMPPVNFDGQVTRCMPACLYTIIIAAKFRGG